MGSTFAHMLPLALGAAVSPTVLAVLLILLGSGTRGRARGLAFAAGALGTLAAVTVVLLPLMRTLNTHHRQRNAVWSIGDLVLGLLLIALGVRNLLHRPEPKPPKQPRDGRAATDVALGIVMMCTNASTLVLYVAALKEIVRGKDGASGEILLVVVLYLIATVMVWLPLLVSFVFPDAADRILGGMNQWMRAHQREVGIAICFGFGIYLLVKGLPGL